MPEDGAKARIAPVDEARLLRAACCDRRLARGDLGVLAVILEHCDDSWMAWPSIRRLSDRARLTKTNATEAVRRLERFGYIRVARKGEGRSQDYQVLASPEIPETVPVGRDSGFPTNRPRAQGQSEGATVPDDRDSAEVPTVPVGRYATVPVDGTKLSPPARTEGTSEDTLEDTEAESTREKPSTVILPDWIPADAWRGWKDHRKQVGRKFTEQAQRLAIRRLDALRAEGHDPRKLIDLAIESGWASFNPRRDRTLANPKGSGTVGAIERDARTDEEIERANAEQLARFGLKDAA